MRNKLIRSIIFLSTLIGFVSTAIADQTPVDTEHQYIVTGTISAKDVAKQYRASHPQYKNSNNDVAYSVPEYIQLMKIEPNPNWIPQTSPQNKVLSQKVAMPASRILPTSPYPLDQGKFGTCVTFSILGAIMSSKQTTNLNDAPSPSCMLQMFKYWMVNAWDGFWIKSYPSFLEANEGGYGYVTENFGQQGRCNMYYKTYQPQGSDEQKSIRLTSINDYTNNSRRYNNGSNEYTRFAASTSADALYGVTREFGNYRTLRINSLYSLIV